MPIIYDSYVLYVIRHKNEEIFLLKKNFHWNLVKITNQNIGIRTGKVQRSRYNIIIFKCIKITSQINNIHSGTIIKCTMHTFTRHTNEKKRTTKL